MLLTVSLGLAYLTTVSLLDAVFAGRRDRARALVAAGVIAVLFAPLRQVLQRGVNRLMYGHRDDPYAVISQLGQRLEATVAPDAVLAGVAETVAHALRLPLVAVDVLRAQSLERAATHGAPAGDVLHLPLRYQGEVVGELVVGTRGPGRGFTTAESRLLAELARHVGVAVYAIRLTADLKVSRDRLVAAREEERRRLRRDLHDGLGPTLAGVALQLDAVRPLIQRTPAAEDVLAKLKTEIRSCIFDIRRLVNDLRPPALDELGLVPAIRQRADNLATANGGGSGLVISVDGPADLGGLPAAAEVAAYRIATEALTNAARHGHGEHCTVTLRLGEDLEVEVEDDGVGLPAEYRPGVGLDSMRERATELGGGCTVERLPAGGTKVRARLPVSGG